MVYLALISIMLNIHKIDVVRNVRSRVQTRVTKTIG